jgi:hypothetical protein
MLSHGEMILRITAGAVCGGFIGYERDVHRRPVGLRTHFIVAMAAATFMVARTPAYRGRAEGVPPRATASPCRPSPKPCSLAARAPRGRERLLAGLEVARGERTGESSCWKASGLGGFETHPPVLEGGSLGYKVASTMFEGRARVFDSGMPVFDAYSQVFEAGSAVFEAGSAVFEAGSAVFEAGSAVFEAGSAVFEAVSRIFEAASSLREGDSLGLDANPFGFDPHASVFVRESGTVSVPLRHGGDGRSYVGSIDAGAR